MGSKKKLLDFLNSQKRSISKEKAFLECGFKSKQKFKKAIDELKSEALLVENGKGKIVSPKVCGFVKAKIVSYCGNFLFAQPFDSVGDIYIPIEKSSGALVDDIVLINRIKNSEKGLSGAVERVVSKGNRLFTGLIKREKKQIFFIPDSGYKRSLQVVKSNTKGAKENDKVQVKIFLKAGKPAAKVVKIYGKATCAKICADAIIDEKGIATVFSDKAILDAENAGKKGIKKKDILKNLYYLTMLFIPATPITLGLSFLIWHNKIKTFNTKIKQQCTAELLESFDSLYWFPKAEKISDEDISKSELFGSYEGRDNDDTFYGTYKGLSFTVSETNMSNLLKGVKNIMAWPVFVGVIIMINSNKTIKNKTIITTKNDFNIKN